MKRILVLIALLFSQLSYAGYVDVSDGIDTIFCDDRYLKLDCSNDPLTAPLDLPELYNSLGSLKIMPDVQGDVNLFGDTDVANAVDGKAFTVNRRAAEGDTYFRIFVNDDQATWIDSNWDISIRSNLASGVIEIGAVASNIVRLIGTVNAIGEPTGTENLPLYHYGYIGTQQRYVSWLVDDADDYFWLTRSNAAILGFKIDMPVIMTSTLGAGAITGTSFIIGGDTLSTLTKVAAFEALANAAGVLTNDGAGALSWGAGGGYDNLTDFVDQTAWRVFYSDGSGDVQELAFGDSGKVLQSNGATSAPTWETPGGGGTPGGNDTELQYNNGGAFGGLSLLTWNDTDFLLGAASTTKLQFRDVAIYIQSANDGHLDLAADVSIDMNGDVDMSTVDLITDTTTGTMLGTGSTQKLGFWGITPVDQPANIGALGSPYTMDDTKTKINSILSLLVEVGLMAAS